MRGILHSVHARFRSEASHRPTVPSAHPPQKSPGTASRTSSGPLAGFGNTLSAYQLAGCSKWRSSKAAGESKPEAYPLGYVEDFDELRTPLADFFSILLIRAQ